MAVVTGSAAAAERLALPLGEGARRRSLTGTRGRAAGFAGYMAVTAVLMAPVMADPAGRYVGSIPDAMQSIWFLSWTADGLAHHHSLLFSGVLNAPNGVNLMWNTPTTLLGVLAAPITLTFGPVVAYNLLLAAAFSGSAWLGFLALERLCGHAPASWIGGLLYGFSPYMVAQSIGHLDLVVMLFPPMALLLLDDILVRQRHRWWVAGGLLGVAAAAQVLVMEEVIAAVAVGAAAPLPVLARTRVRLRPFSPSWRYSAKAGAAALVGFLVVAGAPLWYQLTGPQVPSGLSEVANPTGTDLAALVAPTTNQALTPPPGTAMATHFVAQATGQVGYLGVPVLALLVLAVWTFRREAALRLLAVAGATLTVLSLGPWVTVMGHALPIPLPWALVQHLPLLGNLVPLRLMGLADLCVAAIVALTLSRMRSIGAVRRALITCLAVLSVATWVPSLPRSSTAVPPTLPPHLATALAADGGSVLFAPWPSAAFADPMWYQLSDSFAFRLVGGYAYEVKPDVPLADVLDAPDAAVASTTRDVLSGRRSAAGIVAGYRVLGVGAIVVPPGPQSRSYIALFTAVCGQPPAVEGAFAHWALAAHMQVGGCGHR